MTLHDGTTHAFIAHVLPPLDVQAPAQQAAINEQEIRKDVEERELNMKFQTYCDHVSGYCEGLFRIIDTKYKMAVIPRSHVFFGHDSSFVSRATARGSKGNDLRESRGFDELDVSATI